MNSGLNIPSFTKADSVLNMPGMFLFQVLEDDEIKIGKTIGINKKKIDEVVEAIRIVFKQISENISKFVNFDFSYYEGINKKLKNFVNSKTLRFPGLQVINLSKNHIAVFSKICERILICEKSDGVRYLLIHFTNGKVLFVGRNLEFYLVNLTSNLPNNSQNSGDIVNFLLKNIKEWEIENFLDGELILDKSKLPKEVICKMCEKGSNNFIQIKDIFYEVKFLIFDAVVIGKENIGHIKFRDRLKRLSEFFFLKDKKKKFMTMYNNFTEQSILEALNKIPAGNIHLENQTKFSIELFMKDYYTFDKIEFLYNNMSKKLSHDNDGVIINLDDYPYYSGQSFEIYKWKPANLNTIDFEMTKYRVGDKILYLLNVFETRDKLVPVSILFFHSEEEKSKFTQELEEMSISGKPVIAECYYDFNFNTEETMNFHILCEQGIIKRSESSMKEGLSNLFNYNFDYINSHKKLNLKNYELGSWQFMRFRKDKLTSNHVNTFSSVWNAIIENVQMSDIMLKIKENNTKLNHVALDPNAVLATYLKTSISELKYSPGFLLDDDLPVTATPIVSKSSKSNEDFLKKKRTQEKEIEREVEGIQNESFKVNKNSSTGNVANFSSVESYQSPVKNKPFVANPNSAPVNKKEIKQKKEIERKEKSIKQHSQTLDIAFQMDNLNAKKEIKNQNTSRNLSPPKDSNYQSAPITNNLNISQSNQPATQNKNRFLNQNDSDSIEDSSSEEDLS